MSIINRIITLSKYSLYGLMALVLWSACDEDAQLTLDAQPMADAVIGEALALQILASETNVRFEWKMSTRPVGSQSDLLASDVFISNALYANEDAQEFSSDRGSERHFIPDVLGTYTVTVQAIKGSRESETYTFEIVVQCQPPTWDLTLTSTPSSTDQLLLAQEVQVSAELSSIQSAECPTIAAPDVSLHWELLSVPEGSESTIVTVNEKRVRFIGDRVGMYLLAVQWNDQLGRQGNLLQSYQVTCGDQAPMVDVFVDDMMVDAIVNKPINQAIRLHAQAMDPDASCGLNEELSYHWRSISSPVGSQASLSNTYGENIWFRPDQVGQYQIEVDVADTAGHHTQKVITIDINQCGQHAPQITGVMSSQANPNIGESIQLSVNFDDLDQQPPCELDTQSQVEWKVIQAPANSQADLYPSHATQPIFTPDQAGIYTFQVTVTDESGLSSQSVLPLQVNDCGAHPPSVSLISVPDVIPMYVNTQIEVRAQDADQDCGVHEELTLYWESISLPVGASNIVLPSASPAAQRFNFMAEHAGRYIFSVYAMDAGGHRSESVEMTIQVDPCGSLPPALSDLYTSLDILENPTVARQVDTTQVTHINLPLVGDTSTLNITAFDRNQACLETLGYPSETDTVFHYEWILDEVPSGSLFNWPGIDQPLIDFTPDVAGLYKGKVRVSEENGSVSERRFELQVAACGVSPASDLQVQIQSATQEISVGQLTTFNVTWQDLDTEAPCNLDESHQVTWSIVDRPAGSSIRLSRTNGLNTDVVFDRAGDYQFIVEITDRFGLVSQESFSVTVGRCGSQRLGVELSSSADVIAVGDSVVLNATVTPADESCRYNTGLFHYEWQQLSAPAGSRAVELNNRPTLQWQATHVGIYEFSLRVRDEYGQVSLPTSYRVEVEECGNHAPDVEVPQVVVEDSSLITGGYVRLNTSVNDIDIACGQSQLWHYRWQVIRRPAGSLAAFTDVSSRQSQPSLSVDLAGEYVVEVIVEDETGLSNRAQGSFNVSPCGSAAPVLIGGLSPVNPQLGDTVILQGSASDPDSDVACGLESTFSYEWQVLALPAGIRDLPVLSGPTHRIPITETGVYHLTLTAIDQSGLRSDPVVFLWEVFEGCGLNTPEITSITVVDPRTQNALNPDQLLTNSTVRIRGIVEDLDVNCGAEDAQSYTFSWSVLQQPAPIDISAQLSESDQPIIQLNQAGLYRIQGVAESADGQRTTPQTFTLTVDQCGGFAPQITQIQVNPSLEFNGNPVVEQPIELLLSTDDQDQTQCAIAQTHQASWSIISAPRGSRATINIVNETNDEQVTPITTGAHVSFVPDLAGHYQIRVRVVDQDGHVTDRIQNIEVAQCGLSAPQVVQSQIIADQLIVGESIAVDLEVSDPDTACGLVEDYEIQWYLIQQPSASQSTLFQDEGTRVSFIPDVAGDYRLAVLLSQDHPTRINEVLTSYHVIEPKIVIEACGGLPPIANIAVSAPSNLLQSGPLINLQTYACQNRPFLQLDAQQSVDQNNSCQADDPLSYQWSVRQVDAGLTVTLSDDISETVNLQIDGAGEFEVELQTSNAEGLSDYAYAHIEAIQLESPNAVSVTPNFICANEQTIQINGDHFYQVDRELPTVTLGDQRLVTNTVGQCVDIPQSNLKRCQTMNVTVPAGLGAELYQLHVENPYPLGCVDETAIDLLLISAPTIDTVDPTPICRGQFDGRISLNGSGFFKSNIFGATQIQVNNINAVDPVVDECQVVFPSLDSCQQASFAVPLSQKDEALLRLTLTNPNPSACDPNDLRATYDLIQSEPPIIDDIIPRKICDQGGSLNLIGDHFEANMSVRLGPYLADRVIAVNGEQEVEAQWDAQDDPRFIPDLYEVTARNASGCEETFNELVRVTEGPVPFFVDPPIIYNGITLQATAYLGNLFGGSVTRVQITNENDVDPVPIDLEFSFDINKPSLLKLIVPSGLQAGIYGLTLFDDVNCPGSTGGLLTITDQLTVNIDNFSPPFAWVNGRTAVSAFANETTPFIPTPRSYLSPSSGDECVVDAECVVAQFCRQGSCVNQCTQTEDCNVGSACVQNACIPQASELKAANLSNLTELNGVVDIGFAIGTYDLVVVNPNGSVGLLEKAIKVNPLPPPEIEAVSPGSWKVNITALPIQITGQNFRDVNVNATCLDGGQTSTYALSVISQTASEISVTLNTNNLTATSVCSIRVQNTDDSYDDFSPLTATNPSGNFVSFSQGPDLPVGEERRLPAITYIQIPNASPALYLMGGDLGSEVTALDDNLAAGIDAFGNLQTWRKLDTQLPYPLTHTDAVTIGRFLYIAAGFDGTQDRSEILRAEVLDPLYVPTLDQVDFEFDENIQGLDTGVYYYRVSAVYGANDPNNPNGESLPSEPFPVFIPDIPIGVRLIISWQGLSDAVGYKVYRSPTPDLLLGSEELVAEVDAQTLEFVDEGAGVLRNEKTLLVGDLGNWHVVATLNQSRSRHAVVVANDPVQNEIQHLYVIGGLVNGVATRSYEYVSINTLQERSHSLSNSTFINNALGASLPTNLQASTARSRLKALVATPQEASTLPVNTAFIYVLGGAESDVVEVAEITPGGMLAGFNETESMQRSRAGYAAAIANNNLVSVCGQNGAASSTAEKGEVCGVGNSNRSCDLPEYLSKWSSLGNVGVRNCVDVGSAVARGFFYVVSGGIDASSLISRKVDVALLGGTP